MLAFLPLSFLPLPSCNQAPNDETNYSSRLLTAELKGIKAQLIYMHYGI
jgi:hypothetical protein